MAQSLIVAGALGVRTLEADDIQDLCRWLSDPAVLEFYEGRDRPLDPETARRCYLSKQGDPVTGCIVEWNGRPIGFAQFYALDAAERKTLGYCPAEPVFGMDQFIGEPAYWNQGIGPVWSRRWSSTCAQPWGPAGSSWIRARRTREPSDVTRNQGFAKSKFFPNMRCTSAACEIAG